MEATHRPKQAQHFSTCRKVQNGNSRVHQDFPDSRGVGIVDRSVGRLPAHPHPPKLKEIPKVLPQVTGVPVHLPSFRSSHSPPGLYNDCKGSEANELKPTQVFFVRGLRIPSRFSPCKTHSREMAQLQDLILRLKSKRVFDCKMFDVANWVACLNGENGPGGTPSHEAPSVSSQGALEISSVAGQPPSLDRSHCSTLRLVANSLKSDERCRPSSQRPQYPTLYRRLNESWGPHLDQVLHRV